MQVEGKSHQNTYTYRNPGTNGISCINHCERKEHHPPQKAKVIRKGPDQKRAISNQIPKPKDLNQPCFDGTPWKHRAAEKVKSIH